MLVYQRVHHHSHFRLRLSAAPWPPSAAAAPPPSAWLSGAAAARSRAPRGPGGGRRGTCREDAEKRWFFRKNHRIG